jgi:hypothetical protein
MKGWRPSACQGSKPESGLGKRAYHMPNVGSIGPSFFARSRLRAQTRRGPWVPFSRSSALRPPSRTNDAQASAIMKRRQPFIRLLTAGGAKNEDEGTDGQLGERATPNLSRRCKPKLASKRKNSSDCQARRRGRAVIASEAKRSRGSSSALRSPGSPRRQSPSEKTGVSRRPMAARDDGAAFVLRSVRQSPAWRLQIPLGGRGVSVSH